MAFRMESKPSRFCAVVGCAFNLTSSVTALLALFLPFWVYVNDVLRTTAYDLTEPTNVIYNYGLVQYCLKLKSTHLDINECGLKK